MHDTLKARHESKRVNILKEKLEMINAETLLEASILEAFDKQQMSAAIDIVKKMRAIDFKGLTALASARDVAVSDVTKVLSGNQEQGLIRKIVNLFKDNKENPLVDTLAFANALNNFFGQFSQYVTALNSDSKNNNVTLGTLVTGKSADELDDLSSISGLGSDEKKKLADLQKVIINGLKPEGALANIGKSWVDKYMKGRKGLQQLAKDMLKMTVKDLNTISTSVTNSLKNAEAVGDSAAGAAAQGSVGSTETTGSASATSSVPTSGTSGTKKTGVKTNGAQVNAKPGKTDAIAKKVFDDISSDFAGTDEKQVMSILNTLAANGKLKTLQQRRSASKRLDTFVNIWLHPSGL